MMQWIRKPPNFQWKKLDRAADCSSDHIWKCSNFPPSMRAWQSAWLLTRSPRIYKQTVVSIVLDSNKRSTFWLNGSPSSEESQFNFSINLETNRLLNLVLLVQDRLVKLEVWIRTAASRDCSDSELIEEETLRCVLEKFCLLFGWTVCLASVPADSSASFITKKNEEQQFQVISSSLTCHRPRGTMNTASHSSKTT